MDRGMSPRALLCFFSVAYVGEAAPFTDLRYPPAPGSGGKECTINAECGLPAANCNSLRTECVSMSGACVNGHCVCATEYYGCTNCAAKSTLVPTKTGFEYTTKHPMYDGTGREIDECSVERGDKKCAADRECGGAGGLCIGGRCICPDSWLCDDCSITLTDLLYGLKCGVAQTGGGSCDSSADCGEGSCIKPGGRPPYCVCNPLNSCPRCSQKVQDLASGKVDCSGPLPPSPPSPPSPSPPSPPGGGKYACTEGVCTPSTTGKGVTQQQCAEVCGGSPPPSPPAERFVCVNNQCAVAGDGQKGLPRTECESMCSPLLYLCKANKCVASEVGKLPLDDCHKACDASDASDASDISAPLY